MTYRGHIEGDKIVLDEDVKLPDGATVGDLDQSGGRLAALFFGEDQARYVVAVAAAPDSEAVSRLRDRAFEAGIHMPVIGVTGGAELKLGKARGIPVAELKAAHESWFPQFMGA